MGWEITGCIGWAGATPACLLAEARGHAVTVHLGRRHVGLAYMVSLRGGERVRGRHLGWQFASSIRGS